MKIEVQLFGSVADKLGEREVFVESKENEISTCQLLDDIERNYPDLKSMRQGLAVAVNMAYVGSDHIVHSGDEVALIPPVSGG